MTCYDRGSVVEDDLRLAIGRAKEKGTVLDFRDYTKSTTLPDFWVKFNPDKINVSGLPARDSAMVLKFVSAGSWLEAKARKKYNMSNWPGFSTMGISRENAFIEDDLTIRRLEWCGSSLSQYLVVGADDGRIRVFPAAFLNRDSRIALTNRPQAGHPVPKGKWLLSLEWGRKCKSMDAVLELTLAAYRQGAEWAGVLESVPAPINIEGIDNLQGIPRTHEHRLTDLEGK